MGGDDKSKQGWQDDVKVALDDPKEVDFLARDWLREKGCADNPANRDVMRQWIAKYKAENSSRGRAAIMAWLHKNVTTN